MRDFPSCFGESGVQVADASSGGAAASKAHQNLVTCLYQSQFSGRSCVITLAWSKNLMGQGLSIEIEDSPSGRCLCKVEIKPWLFSKRKGSKGLEAENGKVEIFWDLSAPSSDPGLSRWKISTPPPSNASFIAKREHVYGKKVYYAKAQFCNNGQSHDLAIECDTAGLKDPCLEIRVDKKRVMQVKRLAWKFRGNQTILVDGFPVEVFWDVHNWLFGSPSGSAVFMFQTCQSAEKLLSWSSSQIFGDSQPQGALGFSLILYAWKNE
uniref:DUF868 domain-containing protein n=1 Tax=Ananas comosus var. bracteatus TaxID=296719 RepID=A0A6V7NJ55_ANACO|nr:unnamed protein product [Ananas comosus var. bracteatus]